MAKYNVDLIMTVTVEADSAEEAEQIALEEYMSDDQQYAIAELAEDEDNDEES